jgi:cytochrome P450
MPLEPGFGLQTAPSISPEFLRALPLKSGGTEFSSRNRLHVIFTQPAEVNDVLVTNSDDYLKGEQEIALSKAIGWGLIGMEGNAHKLAQRAASPALRGDSLNSYVSTIRQVAMKHIDSLQSVSELPMRRTLRCLSQEAAERSLFSRSEDDSDYAYQDHVFNLNAILFGAEVATSSPEDALELARSYSASRKNVLGYVSKLIDSWRADPSTGTFLIDYLAGGQDIGGDGFDDFHQQVSVFLQAATETTASLASWAIMLLSDNPGYWQRLRNEAEESGPLNTYDAIMGLGLLDAVVNESLRLYPPAWLIPRIARVETAVGGRKVKAGTRVVVSPYVSQRMTEFFDNPDSFIPERWGARTEALPRGLFFPFGMGNRICIGERYGKLAAKIIILAALERGSFFQAKHSRVEIDNYSLLLNPSPEIQFGLASFR